MPTPPFIRLATPADRRALFDICLRTADSGTDATALYSDADYPGLVWSVPYLDFEPAHCFVVDSGDGAGGYIVGTPDTAAYEARLDRDWWPALRTRYAGRRPTAPFDARVLDYIAAPEHSEGEIVEEYPAHLHINLMPPLQAGGWGRGLMEAELDSLRRAGAPGVHLGVGVTNHRAIGFYRHMGFERLADEPGGLLMGRQL